MSSLSSVNYDEYISIIQEISRGNELTMQQQKKIKNFITNGNMIPQLYRSSFAAVTKSFLEKGNYTISGNITYTGSQTYSGTVNLPTVKEMIVTDNASDGSIEYDINSKVKALKVDSNVDYNLNLIGTSNLNNNVYMKFVIINNSNNSSEAYYASTYTIDSDPSEELNFTAQSTSGTNNVGCKAMQEITIYKMDGIIEVYSNVIFMNSSNTPTPPF